MPVGSSTGPGLSRVGRVAETASTESVPARLAEIRDQLKLLADYL
jgi:hypothetical protein